MTQPSILIIYTGGTIGMASNHETGALSPLKFDNIEEQLPELKKFGYNLSTISFDKLIDSSNLTSEVWIKISDIIKTNYAEYDGFVVLHGTDTMAFSASALSFMFKNLSKPVIFTGSQLPIGMIRTDGKENLITAIEIAAAKENGQSIVPEVCIYFENTLYRGNRTTKFNAEYFNAFSSDNHPHLADVGVNIHYNHYLIQHPEESSKFTVHKKLDNNVAILKLFPGINKNVVESILNIKNLKAIVLETYGAGNASTEEWFINSLKQAINRGIIIANVTQCNEGSVDMEKYETGRSLLKIGVLSGYDITSEAALTKLMFLLGEGFSTEKVKAMFSTSIRGEINVL